MTIEKRIVVHFPGFEPLDADDHRNRYARSAAQAAEVWNCGFETGALEGREMAVEGRGPNWQVASDITILDHNAIITSLRKPGLAMQILKGYCAGLRVIVEGGMFGYFRHAWRFGLFFLFPFLFIAFGIGLSLAIAMIPGMLHLQLWHYLWSLPAALVFFVYGFIPFSDRLHTLHLFADWRLAVRGAQVKDAETLAFIEDAARALDRALEKRADEYLITSHSMGASLALHALGRLLEEKPDRLSGKKVIFATLGGAALQCALLRSAKVLRSRIGLIANCPDVLWFDIQSLTDPIHLYKAHTVAASGFPQAPQPKIVPFRFRTVLSPERYKRIKRDLLRMHRQYVLGPDRRGSFDFTLMTAGPLSAADFRDFTAQNLPPIAADGRIGQA